jgi:hypothetical protein
MERSLTRPYRMVKFFSVLGIFLYLFTIPSFVLTWLVLNTLLFSLVTIVLRTQINFLLWFSASFVCSFVIFLILFDITNRKLKGKCSRCP